MQVNYNSIQHCSTVDYPGKAACVIFFNGCPFRCPTCHNKQTWTEVNMVDVNHIKQQVMACKPFINAVVFSGGEPTMQIEPLMELCIYFKEAGLFVGIETNGFYPTRLNLLKKVCDEIFLDIKAPINEWLAYYKATGHKASYYAINETISRGLMTEIRIVDRGNTEEIINSLHTEYPIRILPFMEEI